MATSSGLFLVTIYNQSQLAERKHVTHHCGNGCSIKRAPFSVSYYNEISGGHIGRGLFGGSVLPTQYCPCECTVHSFWKCAMCCVCRRDTEGRRNTPFFQHDNRVVLRYRVVCYSSTRVLEYLSITMLCSAPKEEKSTYYQDQASYWWQ